MLMFKGANVWVEAAHVTHVSVTAARNQRHSPINMSKKRDDAVGQMGGREMGKI